MIAKTDDALALEQSGVDPERRSTRGLHPLVVAQALGAFNDNVLKTVVSLILVGRAPASGESSAYLSLTGLALVFPYLAFSGLAGQLADRFSKRTLLIATKLAEIAAVAAAVAALWLDQLELMFAALALMATQSTFLSPAKYGILPETLPPSALPRANGLIESTRYLAIILGTAAGGVMLAVPEHRLALIAAVLIGVAASGTAVSLAIAPAPRPVVTMPLRVNPMHGIGLGLRHIMANRALRLAALGITTIELFACLVMFDVILVAKRGMGLGDDQVGLLGVCVGLGAGLGSYVCGRLSGGRVRPGLSFVAAIGGGSALLLLSGATELGAAAPRLVLVGLFGGAAIVPLYALLQREADVGEKGRVIAANNFLNMAGVMAASALLWVLHDLAGMAATRILFWSGLALLLLTAAAIWRWPEYGIGRWVRNPAEPLGPAQPAAPGR